MAEDRWTQEEEVARLQQSQELYPVYSQEHLYRRGGCCNECMSRIPYATLIATVMCILGVGVFCFTVYRGATLSALMFDHVFHFRLAWLEPMQLVFVIGGASMAAIGLMILFLGCLTTGATRYKVYRAWGSRVGGRVSCAVFMVITYLLQMVWLAMLIFLVIVTIMYSMFWALCEDKSKHPEIECINFEQFHFLFPKNTPIDDMKVCKNEVKEFCKDYVERAEVMAIMALISCIIVLLSLIHYLMCLSANYAHIRDQEKFQDLQEMQFITDPDSRMASKERF